MHYVHDNNLKETIYFDYIANATKSVTWINLLTEHRFIFTFSLQKSHSRCSSVPDETRLPVM